MSRAPRATTRIAGVIGDPVHHSLSPVLHNAAFDALGVDWVYVAFPVPAGEAPAAVAAMRVLGIGGLSVTMPHKADVAASVDRLSPVAGRLVSVNTVIARGGELVGDSTDGDGFLDALRLDEGWDPAGRRCLVLGAGGAARAVCLALGAAGAAEVAVVARRPEAAHQAASFSGASGRVRPVDGAADAAADADLVVNATPVGMVPAGPGGDELPFGVDAACFGRGQLVIDLIYHPPTTPLLAAARARGATAVNGVGMLLYQAGRQVTAWTGRDAPLDAMSAALLAALAERGSSPPPGGGRDGDR